MSSDLQPVQETALELKMDIIRDVQRALEEDVGRGDVSAALLDSKLRVKAEIIAREPLFVAGLPWVNEVFRTIDPTLIIKWNVDEASWQNTPCILVSIEGSASAILTAERTALNFLQTLSATATQTYQYVREIEGTKTKLLDTRKTLPGLRKAQKYAVACAGGVNHRMGLYDAYLLKENHIKSAGSITLAIHLARELNPTLFLEVEVETIDELKEALCAKPDRIMLDNFSLDRIKQAVQLSRQNSSIPLEASGNMSLQTVRAVALTGVDFISVGAITKSIQAIDLSLLIREII